MPKDLFLSQSVEEIEELKQAVEDTELSGRGSQYPDLTYEDGIRETIGWLFGDGDHPYKGARWTRPSDDTPNPG
ncbi:MAG: hypothetical protein WC657_02315 [Candidatus Paceibacterota bacterium]|jgi:hypothetical protein